MEQVEFALSQRAYHLIGDGDLSVVVGEKDIGRGGILNSDTTCAASALFQHTGLCHLDLTSTLSLHDKAMVQNCHTGADAVMACLSKRLEERKVDLESPFRFAEVCRRRLHRYDIRFSDLWPAATIVGAEDLVQDGK